MIALVRGEVAVRRADHVVLVASGVGYRLSVSSETLRHVPAVGRETSLHAHLVVRDDALVLFGFATEEERELFLLLVGVPSVGPKMALAVLSGGTPRELVAALAGLGLLGVLATSLNAALEAQPREPALLALLVAASGVTLLGIGAAFWGLVAGILAAAFLRTRQAADPAG